jgi:hypothetical protein
MCLVGVCAMGLLAPPPAASAAQTHPQVPTTPTSQQLFAVSAAAPDDVWGVGYAGRPKILPLVEHWDGSSWSVVQVPNPASDSLATGISGTSATDVTVVGTSGGDMGLQPFAEHWDGLAWTVTYPPTSGEPYVSTAAVYAAAPDDQWAVGTGGGNDQALVEHWDGTSWSAALLGEQNGTLFGVAGTASDNVWAVGMTSAGGGERALLEQWNGQQWTSFDGPSLPPSEDPTLEGVTALSVDDAWAVGWYFHTDPPPMGT